jgi:hypothetical protein
LTLSKMITFRKLGPEPTQPFFLFRVLLGALLSITAFRKLSTWIMESHGLRILTLGEDLWFKGEPSVFSTQGEHANQNGKRRLPKPNRLARKERPHGRSHNRSNPPLSERSMADRGKTGCLPHRRRQVLAASRTPPNLIININHAIIPGML